MTLQEMSRVMELFYAHRASALPPKALADVFDRLIWCLDDNGTTILAVREAWLTSDDRGRVEIALAMDEVFPFKDIDEMNRILSRVAATWPDLAPRCDELRACRAAVETRA